MNSLISPVKMRKVLTVMLLECVILVSILCTVVTICLPAAFFITPAHATTVKKLTSEELADEASVIVKGTVASVTSQWEKEQKVIYTYVHVFVDEYIKGVGSREVTVRQLGGIVDDIGLYIEGAPKFEQGEKVLLYLRPSIRRYDNTYFEVVGLSQGKVPLETSHGVAFGAKNGYVLLVPFAPLLFLSAIRLIKLRRKKVFRHLLCIVAVGIVFLSLLPTQVFAFRLFRTGPTIDPIQPNLFTGGQAVDPTALPPFTHWDHRRFAVGFEIPYTLIDGTADVPGLNEFAAIDAAFQAWEDVNPAIISFTRTFYTGPAPPPLPFRMDGWNVLSWTGDAGDDIQIVAPGANAPPPPNDIVVSAGPDGWIETVVNGDDVYDDVNNVIRAGPDGVCDTTINNFPVGNFSAYTGVYYDRDTGVIFESDIWFNDAETWSIAGPGGTIDVQTMAMHEIGHFIGLAHPIDANDIQVAPVGGAVPPGGVVVAPGLDGTLATNPQGDDIIVGVNAVDGGNGIADTRANNAAYMNPAPNSIMNALYDDTAAANNALSVDDMNGANFLYTPDLGDAPDPYPAKTHSNIQTGTLNDVPIYAPRVGAEHKFGWGVAPPLAPPAPFEFEWLGSLMDNAPDECEAKQVDNDLFDDGVIIWGDLVPGGWLMTTVTISTSGQPGRYVAANPNQWMYLNAWVDWNRDGDWADAGEKIIGAGAPVLGVDAFVSPATPIYGTRIPEWVEPCDTWLRFRLDYAEDVGANRQPWSDPNLNEERGQAAFGEVEDYELPGPCVYLEPKPGRLIDPKNPVCTYWHELHPNFSRYYHLSSWDDTNHDDMLNYCDYIDLTDNETGKVEWYHVERVTVTIKVTLKCHLNYTMYLEYNGTQDEFLTISDPRSTMWHEIYPEYSNQYHLTSWSDTDGSGNLTVSDQIDFEELPGHCWHMDEMATDLIVTPIYRDIAVTNVTPSRPVVHQGSSVNIDVTVENQGDYPESFNVTAYANTTEIETKTITLTSGSSTTTTFTWNTTGFAAGDYAISACAWPVPGEIDIADNTFVNGWVSVAGCFIATAAYGTPMAPQIQVLRDFRDQYLLTNPVGEALVELYYKVSPPMAEFITEHPSLKPLVRAGLMPAVVMSTIAVNTTPAEKIAISGLLALVSVAIWSKKRRGRAPEYS